MGQGGGDRGVDGDDAADVVLGGDPQPQVGALPGPGVGEPAGQAAPRGPVAQADGQLLADLTVVELAGAQVRPPAGGPAGRGVRVLPEVEDGVVAFQQGGVVLHQLGEPGEVDRQEAAAQEAGGDRDRLLRPGRAAAGEERDGSSSVRTRSRPRGRAPAGPELLVAADRRRPPVAGGVADRRQAVLAAEGGAGAGREDLGQDRVLGGPGGGEGVAEPAALPGDPAPVGGGGPGGQAGEQVPQDDQEVVGVPVGADDLAERDAPAGAVQVGGPAVAAVVHAQVAPHQPVHGLVGRQPERPVGQDAGVVDAEQVQLRLPRAGDRAGRVVDPAVALHPAGVAA